MSDYSEWLMREHLRFQRNIDNEHLRLELGQESPGFGHEFPGPGDLGIDLKALMKKQEKAIDAFQCAIEALNKEIKRQQEKKK